VEPQELRVAVCIRGPLLRGEVIAAVDLNDEPRRRHEEVDDIRRERMLPPNPTPDPPHAEEVPECALGVSSRGTMRTSTNSEPRKEGGAVLVVHAVPARKFRDRTRGVSRALP
jgi:hypothetical protein